MDSILKQLQEEYNLDIESPFTIRVGNETHQLHCLIKGYGAKNGMVIDKDWYKIKAIQEELEKNDYGCSCIEITDTEGFQEVLDDWGKSNA
ncbi:MAG: hypothetical protein OEW58_00595 [Gammaproteobacteria bacterium]|nr:hypothetical protein [Gammaproteobacteria bacterium]